MNADVPPIVRDARLLPPFESLKKRKKEKKKKRKKEKKKKRK